MSIEATEATTFTAPPRPWAAKADELAEKEGHWADFAAWRWWITETVDNVMDQSTPLDHTLEYDQEIALYVVMCKLVDGEYQGKGSTDV